MVPLHGVQVRAQRGFTLIELMVAVAVIAILAVVVIPQFMGSSRKVKSDTEVASMFSEITTREEQWKIENPAYADVAQCPTTTSPTGVKITDTAVTACNADWTTLRINPQEQTLRCMYQVVAGPGSTTVTNPDGFVWASPPNNWWYARATCDTKGDGGTQTEYFMASSNPKIQKRNEGN